MASTYEPISTTTLSSAANSVSFGSIPQTYTDLVIVIGNLVTSVNTDSIAMYYNSDTGSNYVYQYAAGNGSSTYSGNLTTPTAGTTNWLSSAEVSNSTIGQMIINIFNYTNSSTYKVSQTMVGTASNAVAFFSNQWKSTAAITTVDLKVQGSDTFAAGTVVTMYGIKAA